MSWNLLTSAGLLPPRKVLRAARDSLVLSLDQQPERRGESRLFNQALGVAPRGLMLLNLSRSGMAVTVRRRCTFARGERFKVSFDDGTHRTDLTGRVCWTRSMWPRLSIESEGSEYFQAAGLALEGPASTEERDRWKSLRELVGEGSAALDIKVSPLR